MVPGKNAVALFPYLLHPLAVVLRDGAAFRPPAHQKVGGVIQSGSEVVQRDLRKPIQKGQLPVQTFLLHGSDRTGSPVADTDVLTLHHGAAEIGGPAVALLEQERLKFPAVGHKIVRVVPAAVLKQLPEGSHRAVLQQFPEHRKAVQPLLHLFKIQWVHFLVSVGLPQDGALIGAGDHAGIPAQPAGGDVGLRLDIDSLPGGQLLVGDQQLYGGIGNVNGDLVALLHQSDGAAGRRR